MHVQAFVPEATIERLKVGTIRRFARSGEVERHAEVVGRSVQRPADELAPVVHIDTLRCLSGLCADPRYDLGYVLTSDRLIGVDSQALSAGIVDYRQGPEAAPVEERVGNKIHTPQLAWTRSSYAFEAMGGLPIPTREVAAQVQPFEPIQEVDILVVHAPALSEYQDADASLTAAHARLGDLANAGAHGRVERRWAGSGVLSETTARRRWRAAPRPGSDRPGAG